MDSHCLQIHREEISYRKTRELAILATEKPMTAVMGEKGQFKPARELAKLAIDPNVTAVTNDKVGTFGRKPASRTTCPLHAFIS